MSANHLDALDRSEGQNEKPTERSKICRLPDECFDSEGCLRLSDAIRHMVERNLPHGRR